MEPGESRQRMADALKKLQARLSEWQTEGQELQNQLVHLTMAVFLDNRPVTEEEEAWAAQLGAEVSDRLR